MYGQISGNNVLKTDLGHDANAPCHAGQSSDARASEQSQASIASVGFNELNV
jgi:hypothetical protein